MAIPAPQGSALALDSRGLDSLRSRARDDPRAAAGAAAREFEALLVQQMMKAMREAMPQDGPLASDSGRTWVGMFDREISQKIASRGIGLAQAIERQLARQVGAKAVDDAADAGQGVPAGRRAEARGAPDAPARVGLAAGLEARRAVPAAPVAAPAPADAALKATKGGDADRRATSGVADTVRVFAERMRPHAEAAAKALGVSADWLIGQAGLETGWGRHQPKAADGSSSNNLFGMKTGTRWEGSSVLATTLEVAGGVARPAVAAFRAYSTVGEAFADYAKVLKSSRRYAGALAGATDAKSWAGGLARAGYATDPQYAQKLEQAIAMVGRHAPTPTQLSLAATDNQRVAPRKA